ncbi:MAG: hypothetical protein JKY31_09570 [Rhodobacteraceae bacterium]|nr:hypothetical protein [Paracoccaceae bacterium]
MKALVWIVGIVLVLAAVGSILSDSEAQDPRQRETSWFQGGTLHDSTIEEWSAATYTNQLATAADWTAGVIGQDEFERIGLEGVRRKAGNLINCIKGSTDELSGLGALSTAEIGAACILLMGW